MITCSNCQSSCNSCGSCTNTTCFNCSTIPCEACVDTIGADCVFLTHDLSYGKQAIQKSATSQFINLENVILQLLAKIDRLEFEIEYIKRSCCPTSVCDIPIIASISLG